MTTAITYAPVAVEPLIWTVRGLKVIAAADLAKVYGVPTFRLNEAVKRNPERFPEDFRLQLTHEEAEQWRRSRSQNAILKRGQNIKYLPYVFTEHGAIMAATVLNSPQAVAMSVFVVRAFIRMRQELARTKELADKLAELDRKLTSRLDTHEAAIRRLLADMKGLLSPAPSTQGAPKQIGFHVREHRGAYRVRRRRRL